jgi:hypothetical protein
MGSLFPSNIGIYLGSQLNVILMVMEKIVILSIKYNPKILTK